MMRTQISLDPETYAQARAEAKRRGISFAELVRRALSRMLHDGADGPPWMRFAGAIQGGDHDASQTVDEVVYGRRRP
jgi:hypothetical protein